MKRSLSPAHHVMPCIILVLCRVLSSGELPSPDVTLQYWTYILQNHELINQPVVLSYSRETVLRHPPNPILHSLRALSKIFWTFQTYRPAWHISREDPSDQRASSSRKTQVIREISSSWLGTARWTCKGPSEQAEGMGTGLRCQLLPMLKSPSAQLCT